MRFSHAPIITLALTLAMAGCRAPLVASTAGARRAAASAMPATATPATSLAPPLSSSTPGPPSDGETPGSALGGTPPTSLPIAGKQATFSGIVLGLDGKPAIGALVRAQVISDQGTSLIAKVKDPAAYRLAQVQTSTKTDAEGHFTIEAASERPLNIEAQFAGAEDVKALTLHVAPNTIGLTLQLAYTGTISGKVAAPGAPGVTDFEGVDVFIPGTSYAAKADKSGSFTMANVPVGTFEVVAGRDGLGRASSAGVEVRSKATTIANLHLEVQAPVIETLSAITGRPGDLLTITGQRFGAGKGSPFQITVGGLSVSNPERTSDTKLAIAIPAAAISGDIIVTVGGVASNAFHFTVIRGLANPTVTTVAGTDASGDRDGTGSGAQFDGPTGIAFAPDGAIYVSDTGNGAIRRIVDGTVTTIAGTPPGVKQTPEGIDGIKVPMGLAFDREGRLYVADRGANCIHRLTFDPANSTKHATVSVFAGTRAAGHGDGPAATATFSGLEGLTFDAAGDLFVSDTGNDLIRRIAMADPTHPVTTFAGIFKAAGLENGPSATAEFSQPMGLAFDLAGNLFVADYGNESIRKIALTDPQHGVTTIAGNGDSESQDGKGIDASLCGPTALIFDQQGTLFVTETACSAMIRAIDPTGKVSTFAGNPDLMAAFLDGLAIGSKFDAPGGVAVDALGNLYVCDSADNRLRKITRFTDR